MRRLLYVVSRVYFRVQVHGIENLPPEGRVVLAPNHASHLDPTSVTCGLPRPAHFLAKASLFKGLFGKFLRSVNCYPLHASGIDLAAVRTCMEVLDRDLLLVIFPEGQRTCSGSFCEMKPGAAMLAMNTGAPIVPVYISGSYAAMPRGSKFPRPGKIDVFIGKPFHVPEPAPVHAVRRRQYAQCNQQILEQWTSLRQSALSVETD